GGVHTTAVPDRVIARPEVDYICLGEGDVAFLKTLAAIEKKDVSSPLPNTWFKTAEGRIIQGPQIGFIQNLDALPFFDKSLWEDYFNMSDYYITMASRGCPLRCTFCFNSFFANLPERNKGKYVRYRSPAHMLAELRWAKKRYQPKMIGFFDDVFTLDKKWLMTFLDGYKKDIRTPFQIFTHLNHMDAETVRLLAEAGCDAAEIGMETLDEEYKNTYLKRHESKETTAEVIRLTREYHIRSRMDHMLGLPGEPLEAQETARQFYIENPPARINSYWVNYFPGTELQNIAIQFGVISEADAEALNEGFSFDLDSYNRSHKLFTREQLRHCRTYQVLFKLIPFLPKKIISRLKPGVFKAMPAFISEGLAFMTDLIGGIVTGEAEFLIYAKYLIFHIYRTLLGKLGFRKPRRMRHLAPDPRAVCVHTADGSGHEAPCDCQRLFLQDLTD
ncbi:MAG: radical SAM protein, partial [Candidatus Omnitrophota bacterium]